jgi:single-strand DNA-binding protein
MEIVARITSDARITKTKTGKEVVGFTVAINDYYKPRDGDGVQLTTFVRCAYWGPVRMADYLLKGGLVQLGGRLGVEAFISKSGEPVGVITCRVTSIKLHTKPSGSTQRTAETIPAAENDDDLPF